MHSQEIASAEASRASVSFDHAELWAACGAWWRGLAAKIRKRRVTKRARVHGLGAPSRTGRQLLQRVVAVDLKAKVLKQLE